MSARNRNQKKTKISQEARREQKREQTSRIIKKVAGGAFANDDLNVSRARGFSQRKMQGSYEPSEGMSFEVSQPEPRCAICGKPIERIETALVTRKRFAQSILNNDASDPGDLRSDLVSENGCCGSDSAAADGIESDGTEDGTELERAQSIASDGVSGFSGESADNGSVGRDLRDCFCHFDCAVSYIRSSHQVKAPDRISYVGGGNFAVFRYGRKRSEFTISEKIAFESEEDRRAMQEYVEGLKK